MHALLDEERRSLLRLSVMLVCGAVAVLPATIAPTSIIAQASSSQRYARFVVPDVPRRLEFPTISVKRDPFVADGSDQPVGQGQPIDIVLPANAGADEQSVQRASGRAPVVRGVVLGDAPQALIDAGSGVKIFALGDRLGDDTIRAIDAVGVTLSNGTVLRIVKVQQ